MKRRTPVVSGTLAGTAAVAAFVVASRRRYLRLGATAAEAAMSLSGDAILPRADLVATRAITIEAPPPKVWPWLVQMGQGRGGFYSYDALENLVGCDLHSADRIVDEWQELAVGDAVRLHPDVPLTVAEIEEGSAIVLRGGVPLGDTPPPYDFTWAFVLRDGADGTTRLVIRERWAYHQRWARLVVEPAEAVSAVMSHKMLRGIKDRAEGARPA
jgi:hypothetical protein